MKPIQKALFAVVAGAVVLGAGALVGSGPAHTQGASKDVVVTNTTAAPVPVEDVRDANEVFQVKQQFEFPPDAMVITPGPWGIVYEVPAGKRAVIEQVSFRSPHPGQELVHLMLDTFADGVEGWHHFAPSRVAQLSSLPTTWSVGTERVRIYADPGTKVLAYALRSGTTSSSGHLFLTLSGYLVDVP